MTLKSALQDVKETTLSAVAGLLGKLAYLASLRRKGRYAHWGMESIHGLESSERALRTVHAEVLKSVLRAPISTLEEDLKLVSDHAGMEAERYVERMRSRFDDLLPEGKQDSASAIHLNSVLLSLSHLEKNRERATRLTS
jgi:hypothetical protein